MDNNKLQSFKEAAYFDYFRTFSTGTMNTIKRLELEFKDQLNHNYFFQPNSMLKRVKSLLNSYQILILQINDSFQFMEVPQFGQCILKIFLQMMSIIKWLLKCMSIKPVVKQAEGKKNERNTINLVKKQQKVDQQREMYRTRERAFYLLEDMEKDINRIQQEHIQSNKLAQSKSLSLNKEKFMMIKPSDSQMLLEQAVISLVKNGENLNQFVQFREKLMKQQPIQNAIDNFSKIKQFYENQCSIQIKNIKLKLHQTFLNYLSEQERIKKLSMVDASCQVKIQQKTTPVQQIKESKVIKKLNQTLKQVQYELFKEKNQVQLLKKLLKLKTQQYEEELMKYRTQKIIKEMKTQKEIQLTSIINNNSSVVQKPKLKQQIINEVKFQPDDDTQKKQRKPKIYRTKFSVPTKSKVDNKQQQFNPKQDNFSIQNQTVYFKYVHQRQRIANFQRPKTNKSNSHKSQSQSIKDISNIQFASSKTQKIGLISKIVIEKSNQQRAMQFISKIFQISIKNPISLNLQQKMINYCLKRQDQNYNIKSQIRSKTPFLQKRHETVGVLSEKSKPIIIIKDIQQNKKLKQKQNNIDSNIAESIKESKNKKLLHKSSSSHFYDESCKQNLSDRLSFALQTIVNAQFTKETLIQIFFYQENARNYQFLNLNHEDLFKKQPLKKNKLTLTGCLKVGKQKVTKNMQLQKINSLINILMKQLNTLKRLQKPIYLQARIFLRYPFSSLNHQKNKIWEEMEKEQPQIEIYELRKQINRILRIHSNCQSYKSEETKKSLHFCKHIINFCKKMGVIIS